MALTGVGCATSLPLLVEPRAAEPGRGRVVLGGAALVPVGGASEVLAQASGDTAGPEHLDSGAAVAMLSRPGVAPLVRTTLGVVPGLEANLRWGGREVGFGLRYVAWEQRTEMGGATTLSAGLESRVLVAGLPDDGLLPRVRAHDFSGVGAAVPVIAAWQSDAGLVRAWVGAIAGWDRAAANLEYRPSAGVSAPDDGVPFGRQQAEMSRPWLSLVTGLGVGFRDVHASVELGIEHDWLRARVDDRRTNLSLWMLAPAFALSVKL